MPTYYFKKEEGNQLKVVLEPDSFTMEINSDGTAKVKFILPIQDSSNTCEIEFSRVNYMFVDRGIKLTLC